MKRCLSRDTHVVRKDLFRIFPGSFVCMSVYEDSVVCTIPLSFIEVYFGFDIGFSFLLSHSALGLRLYLDYVL